MRMTDQERLWARFLSYLNSRPLDSWRVRGWLGEPEKYGRSLYRVQMALPGGRWWTFEKGLGQLERPTALALPPGRGVEGRVLDLRDATCHPDRTALVRLMDMLQLRIAARFPEVDEDGHPHIKGIVIGADVFVDCPFCGMIHIHGTGYSNPAIEEAIGHRRSHCRGRSGGYFIERWDAAPKEIERHYQTRAGKEYRWRWRAG